MPGQLDDLAVISCHYNPCNYHSRNNNLGAFIASMRRQEIPLFMVELAFPNQPFSTSSANWVLRLRGRDIMWHKERLINIVIPTLPNRYTKIAWVDADALFPNHKWYEAASRLLDEFDIIQLFETAKQIAAPGGLTRRVRGLASYINRGGVDPFKFDTSLTWPGLGWAAKRDLLISHGLFDRMIVGGADTYMSMASFGRLDSWFDWHLEQLTPELRTEWAEWSQHFFADIGGRVGFVPGEVTQLGHGSRSNRRYVERLSILVDNQFNPSADLAADVQGVWEWATPKLSLHRAVRLYFAQRREDDDGDTK